MGGPSCFLVPAAILYDNPGVYLDEYSKIHRHVFSKIGNLFESDFVSPDDYGVAKVFNLPYSDEYMEFNKKNQSEFRIPFNEFKRPSFFEELYVVLKHNPECFYEDLELDIFDKIFPHHDYGYKKGDFVEPSLSNINPDFKYQVSEVLSHYFSHNPLEDPLGEVTLYYQKLLVRAIDNNTEQFNFSNIEELSDLFPQFSPQNMFDYSTEYGFLYPFNYNHRDEYLNHFRWIKKNNKYFLDTQTLNDKLSFNSFFGNDSRSRSFYGESWEHSRSSHIFSLTDLVLTAEAIRREEFGLLRSTYSEESFRQNIFPFKYSDETTYRRYESALICSELSAQAKREGWTNTEFLREFIRLKKIESARQNMLLFGTPEIPFNEIQKMFNTEKQVVAEKTKKDCERRQKLHEEWLESQEGKIPF